MPQIFDTPWEEATLTCNASTANLAIALVFASGTRKARIYTTTNAAKHAYAGTDQAAIGSHYFIINADNGIEVAVRDRLPQDEQRAAGYFTVATNPTDAQLITIADGTSTVIFEFDTSGDGVAGTNTSVDSSAGNTATTATNLAAAISASALLVEADVHFDTTNRVDWIATTAASVTITNGTSGKVTNVNLNDMNRRDIQFVASATTSTVLQIQTEGE